MRKTAEHKRLAEERERKHNWKRWGPYLSERQWGTVREDYSPDGNVWEYFPHDHSRSRAYRWGEDGLLGITDRQCRLCFSLALWNEKDPILKERLFGLTGPEGNHGEDVKECYYYLDSTPTHSYMRALYKYPQAEFPYHQLVHENRARGRNESEYELSDTGIFDSGNYFDVFVEYAKASPDDIAIRITVENRSMNPAPIHILPTLLFRNTWSWGRTGEGYSAEPNIKLLDSRRMITRHETLEPFYLITEPGDPASGPQPLFTRNETNIFRLFDRENPMPYVKDSFHEYVIHGKSDAVNPASDGTKAAFHYHCTIPGKSSKVIHLRLVSEKSARENVKPVSVSSIIEIRKKEADLYYQSVHGKKFSEQEKLVLRQADAGLLWSKQFYFYSVKDWQEGDPMQPNSERQSKRNSDWKHLYNRDIISMPDKWEYPWYASWDLAFHTVAFARIDPDFAKQQLLLLLREWYMHPNGQIPAYEFGFSDVNPPVHAWACWRVYQMDAEHHKPDRDFLKRTFLKLLLNFTWWVNRKDIHGKNLFSGGFLGLDNIGVFDRGAPLPKGGVLEQADATAWMAFYCATMLSISLELAREDAAFDDISSKLLEHFVSITQAINHFGGMGLWDQLDGFYYDQLQTEEGSTLLRVRSLVGIIPLLAVEVLDEEVIDKLPGFKKRLEWFIRHAPDLSKLIIKKDRKLLFAVPSEERLHRMLKYVLDESEFLSRYGIRSLSKIHAEYPYSISLDGKEYSVDYCPGDSNTFYFGGNSNWRGPIWFPINYLLIESLETLQSFYGESFTVECPTGSRRFLNLEQVAHELAARLSSLFIPDADGFRACHGDSALYRDDPHFRNLILFYEHFHGETGRGIGASHQTGWTALVTLCLERGRM